MSRKPPVSPAVSGPTTGAGLPRIDRRRLGDLAYEEVRKRIVSGDFPMGSRLNEVRLATDLGVSRAPVREALRRLSEEGLVVERPHLGAVVRELDAAALVDLYNVRSAIESLAIRLATRRRMDTAPLRALVKRMVSAAKVGDYALVARHELDFHSVITDNSGNQVLLGIFHALQGQVLIGLALDDSAYPDLEEVPREHLPLIDVIESGDEVRAAILMQEHIVSTVGSLVSRLGGSPADLIAPASEA
jgi:DNA-binding GntR family transcriptional regulator